MPTQTEADVIRTSEGIVKNVTDIGTAGSVGNLDGGEAGSEYGGIEIIDGGDVNGN